LFFWSRCSLPQFLGFGGIAAQPLASAQILFLVVPRACLFSFLTGRRSLG